MTLSVNTIAYAHVYTCVLAHARTHTHTHTHTHTLTHSHSHTHTHTRINTHTLQRRQYTTTNNNRIQRRYSRFFTISSQCCELSLTYMLKWSGHNRVQIMCNTSSAYHVQVSCYMPTWYEGTAQLLSLTDLNSHLYELYFIG